MILLGLVSLLTDVASEMVVPLLPLFLTVVLGGSATLLGLIEGLAEAVASVLKLFAGRWADRAGRSRPFVLAGYGLSAAARPLVALALAPWHLLLVRVVDRIGKGLRSSPRDALIAAAVAPGERGRAFGLQRGLDHTGAILGPLLAFAFLACCSQDLRLLFALSAIPGGLALALAYVAARDPPAPDAHAPLAPPGPIALGAPPPGGEAPRSSRQPDPPREPGGAALASFLVPLALFSLGRTSDVFLLRRAGAVATPLEALPLVWTLLHASKVLASLPGGSWADRWGRRPVVALGWGLHALVYLGLAFAESQEAVLALVVLHGLHHGLSEGAEKAWVADVAPARARGGAFGWYHLVLGALTLAANVGFGALWEHAGSSTAFAAGAALAGLALLLLVSLARLERGAAPA